MTVEFRHRTTDDKFGTNEWVLIENGHETIITIADFRDDGGKFVVYMGDDEWGEAASFAEAQEIVRQLIG